MSQAPEKQANIFMGLVIAAIITGTAAIANILFETCPELFYFTDPLEQCQVEILISTALGLAVALLCWARQRLKLSIEEFERYEQLHRMVQKQRADYLTIFDSVPAMIWYKDKDGKILRANRPAAKSLGLPVERLIGKCDYELFPDTADQSRADDIEVVNSGQPQFGKISQVQTSCGEKKWITLSSKGC